MDRLTEEFMRLTVDILNEFYPLLHAAYMILNILMITILVFNIMMLLFAINRQVAHRALREIKYSLMNIIMLTAVKYTIDFFRSLGEKVPEKTATQDGSGAWVMNLIIVGLIILFIVLMYVLRYITAREIPDQGFETVVPTTNHEPAVSEKEEIAVTPRNRRKITLGYKKGDDSDVN